MPFAVCQRLSRALHLRRQHGVGQQQRAVWRLQVPASKRRGMAAVGWCRCYSAGQSGDEGVRQAGQAVTPPPPWMVPGMDAIASVWIWIFASWCSVAETPVGQSLFFIKQPLFATRGHAHRGSGRRKQARSRHARRPCGIWNGDWGGRRRTDGKRRRRDSRRGQAKDMDGQRFNCDVMKW